MGNLANSQPLAAVLLALVLTALCLAESKNQDRPAPDVTAVFSEPTETFATSGP